VKRRYRINPARIVEVERGVVSAVTMLED